MTIRQPCSWHWGLLEEMLAKAGLARLETRELLSGRGGFKFGLNTATK